MTSPAAFLAAPRIRAELVAVGWELFSALLFISAVVPAAFSTPWPAVIFLGSIGVSAALSGPLARRGDPGFVTAGAIRAVSWPLAVSPLLARSLIEARPGSPSWAGLLVAAVAFGVMAGGLRRAIYRRILDPAGRLAPAETDPAAIATSLRARLAESATAAGIVGGHILLLFSVAFLRTASQVIFRAWFEVVPLLALLGTGGFTLAVRPATRTIVDALRAGPTGDPTLLGRGLAQAERLPDVLAVLNFIVWTACTAIGIATVRLGPWSAGDALMQLGFGSLFAFGVSFYQRAWHKDTLAPAVLALRDWTSEGFDAAGAVSGGAPPIPLRRRMLRDFGLPLLFTGMLSLFSSIGLYRALAADLSVQEHFNAITALFASFSLLLIAALGVMARAARELSRPMAKLARAADEVARGHLDSAVPRLAGPEEVVGLGESVERMRDALSRTIAELEAERAGLEAKVEARTAELQHALDELKRTQAALIHGERLASIGELVSGVAHEIYNPLNAIAGAAEPLERLAEELRSMIEAHRAAEEELSPERRAQLARLREELDVDAALDDLAGIATVVRRGVDRSVRIVANLKSFSRVPGEAMPADLHAGLEETLLLLGPRLRAAGVEVNRRYGDLPSVTCRSGEINQVFMNLLVNAVQALEGSAGDRERRIVLSTRIEGDMAAIAVADSGPGVPAEIARRIFDPFFTTKPRGQGTGLGLSISTEIVRRHGGALSLEPDGPAGAGAAYRLPAGAAYRLPAGACFVCRLPLAPPPSRPSLGHAIAGVPESS